MLHVAITFDYELFFGENLADEDEILFSPTKQLLNSLDKYNAKATFFVDVLSVYMHEKMGLNSYCKKFINQIQEMVRTGHDVQLHIHPNWLTSEHKNGKWIFDSRNYNIHAIGFKNDTEMSADHVIRWGVDFLEKNLRVIDSNYSCLAYRAGGYYIQPHTELFKALNRHGIWIDSSVAIQQKNDTINIYDYTEIPSQRNGWWVKNDGALVTQSSSHDGDTYEVPIICTSRSLVRRLLHPETEKPLQRRKLKGSFIGQLSHLSVRPTWIRKVKVLLSYNKAKPMLTLDSLRYGAIHREIFKRARHTKEDEYVAIIGHPKLIDDIWLENFEAFLKGFEKDTGCCLVTMTEISGKIKRHN